MTVLLVASLSKSLTLPITTGKMRYRKLQELCAQQNRYTGRHTFALIFSSLTSAIASVDMILKVLLSVFGFVVICACSISMRQLCDSQTSTRTS